MRFATTLRDAAELVEEGLAPAADLSDLEKVGARYAIAITPELAELIDANDPSDPIARQFVPTREE
jgi:lysine 2,3-aminomutase